ncbi:MAG: RiPP maturation radical SAM C-methyltransferase [Candidatus Thermoplasmatota archaeon]
MEPVCSNTRILLLSMPYAQIDIPSIQLPLLKTYLQQRNIPVHTQHLYLKAAEIYGLSSYLSLITPPHTPYTSQMIFTKYLFPDHWSVTKDQIQQKYEQQNAIKKDQQNNLTFDDYEQRTDQFYHWTLNNISWQNYDLIGFTVNYGQLLPSLALAHTIKQRWPDKKIILGGSRTTADLGIGILKAFPFIDYAVSGDGEEALYQLATAQPENTIPGLIYRSNNTVVSNSMQTTLDLNTLPIPDYTDFYHDISQVTDDIACYFLYHGKLPVEISRGCQWNKCTFCNLAFQHKNYREKKTERIIEEIQTLSQTYQMLQFHLIGNTLPKENLHLLVEKLKPLNLFFFAEARADQLTRDDYTLLKEAGFNTIQTGIESFSKHYLKKMNKGTRVIDNIAALKYCQENHITNLYNLIIHYPNEDRQDYEETKKIVEKIQTYLDPPQLAELCILYGSKIYQHPEQFNIQKLEPTSHDTLMFPPDILKNNFSFVYTATPIIPNPPQNDWDNLITTWNNHAHQRKEKINTSTNPFSRYVFYYVDVHSFLKIYDHRDPKFFKYYVLENIERDIFLTCTTITSLTELHDKYPTLPDYELAAILNTFEQQDLLYHEDNYYLSLPLDFMKLNHRTRPQPTKQPGLLLATPA